MFKKSSDYGATPETIGGMSRLALTEDDASFRAWFKDEALSMGCEVRVDRVGNMFAVLPGRNRSLPPIGTVTRQKSVRSACTDLQHHF
jgi:acetylornithine deacetylase/succinyl-diaminopimelate desuccinylase-like protein